MDPDDEAASRKLTNFMAGKVVKEVRVTDTRYRYDDQSTGTLIIEFTDGASFALSECGQAGWFEFTCFTQ